MKRIVFSAFFILSGFAMSAQNIVNGTVIDKGGNPIASAKVEAVGTDKSCLTNLDGTFSLEIPQNADRLKIDYLGMKAKLVKAEQGLTVTLREASRWSGVYDEYQNVMSIQGLLPSNFQYDTPAVGFTFGRVKEAGWYLKALWTMNNVKANYAAVIAGGMIRLGCPVYLYLGGGICSREIAHNLTDGNYYKDTRYPINSIGYAVDAGLMLRINDFFINAGTIINFSDHFSGNISPASLNIGVGFCL